MNGRRGVTRAECIAAIVVVALVATFVVVVLAAGRRQGRTRICESNLKQHGIFLSNYASDYSDVIAGFSWRAGSPRSGRGGVPATTDLEAVIAEATDTIFHRTGIDLDEGNDWLPNVSYSLLTLQDYRADLFPSLLNFCPADKHRLWTAIPFSEEERQVRKGGYRIEPPDPLPETRSPRWQFAASYQLVPATYSPDEATAAGRTISQGATDGKYLVPTVKPFGDHMRRLDQAAFPGQKVLVMDSHDRHFSSSPHFYAHADAKQPLLFFDNSVQVHRTRDTNPGFRPNDPSNPQDTLFSYAPIGDAAKWNPPPRTPDGDHNLKGWYRWTRGGLRGRDVGAAVPARSEPLAPPDAAEFVTAEP